MSTMKQSIRALEKEITAIGRRMYERGYVAANDGNISVRLDNDTVLITPSGVSKGCIKPGDMLLVDMGGKLMAGTKKPSSEMNMHFHIYRNRPDVKSVCHAHPPYATGFAVAGVPLNPRILPEVVITLGAVPLVEYGTTGTDELSLVLSRYLQNYDAFLLANHGVVTIGDTLVNAYHKMETVEHAAKIQFIAERIGKVKELNKKQIQELINLRSSFNVRVSVGFPLATPKKVTRKSR